MNISCIAKFTTVNPAETSRYQGYCLLDMRRPGENAVFLQSQTVMAIVRRAVKKVPPTGPVIARAGPTVGEPHSLRNIASAPAKSAE